MASFLVRPITIGAAVCCSECRGRMDATVWIPVAPEGSERASWLFWRCRVTPDHITEALPIPRGLSPSTPLCKTVGE